MRKQIFIVGAGILGILLCFAYALSTHRQTNVNLAASPAAAHIKLMTGKSIFPGNFHLKAGLYHATASYTGFSTKTIDFTVNKSGITNVTVLLIPSSGVGDKYLADHPEEQGVREQLGSTAFKQSDQTRQKQNPLINDLPYIERYFRVDYGASKAHPDDSDAVGIYITFYDPVGKEQALNWIQSQGVDPNTLEIIYVDQTSPSPDT